MTVSDVSSAQPVHAAEPVMSKSSAAPVPPAGGGGDHDGKGSPHSAGLMNIKA